MLGRAVEAKQATAASAKQPPLAKHLSSSSNPSSASKQQTQNTIDGMYSKKRPFQAPLANGSSKPTRPLQTHSVNVLSSSVRSAGGGKSFTGLYNTSDSFKEEPEVISLSSSASQGSRTVSQAIYDAAPIIPLNSDDFSDDADLDLDYIPANTLPTIPAKSQRTEDDGKQDKQLPASTLSSFDPSPSNMAPPPHNVKRSSPADDDPARAVAKRPKRELPWPKESGETNGDARGRQQVGSAAPAPKKEDPLWATTNSAIKAQKKQFKTQSKENGKVDVSLEDMREAMKSVAPKPNAVLALSSEQKRVKKLVVEEGRSVFFTGPAGTGKSVLMRSIIEDLKKRYARDPERIAVTASTGLAACNIGGMTLHSFSGIGLGKEDANILVKKIRRNPKAKNRWLKTKVLIIDEISMVDGELFDKLSQIGRIIRNNGQPWGGIQLVITGDFFQLPPVPEGSKQRESKFAFDAATWNISIDHTIGLTQVFRQRDPEFAAMLNEMRLGTISDETVRSFQELRRPLNFNDGLEVTELFPTRYEVENSNQRRLKALTGKSYFYKSVDTGDDKIRDRLLANMMAPPTLELKKGAQVMLIKNMDDTLVNGSLGTVVAFMSQSTFEVKGVGVDDFDDGDPEARRRAKFTNALAEAAKGDTTEYPVVSFHAVDGTQRQMLLAPEDWKVELPTGEVQASRQQLPLILAWALSIHKAQGQTLERVKVDLGKVFEKGQAYVALSRATSKQGLCVLNFHKSKVMAHGRVVEFYNKLYSVESVMEKKQTALSFAFNKSLPRAGSAIHPVGIPDDEEQEELMAAYG